MQRADFISQDGVVFAKLPGPVSDVLSGPPARGRQATRVVRARVVFPRGGCFRAGGYREPRAEKESLGEVLVCAMARKPASSGQKGSEEH